ncbi:MAG: hypothetical protein JWP89_4598 [Schlesneria sp.]|nr:hypothetical protein [Schlesneria sp.]
MKSRLLAVATTLVWLASTNISFAVEPYLDFVQGLRDRQYYDYALIYLDQISAKDSTPAEIKQVVPYQKAIILQESARTNRSADRQLEQLNQAEAYLEEFVKANPNHPSAADANSDRATILLDKGRAEVLQSKAPSNQGTKRDFQNKARETIAKARTVFQTAYDQHEANFKKFPSFIEQQKDPQLYAARAKTEQNLITASLMLGRCTYEEAQTYEPDSNDFKQLLSKAAEEFEKMHQKYRSQVGGLYARAYQGKCYEEQRDLQKAMGIYKELLDHPGNDASLSALKTQTLYFMLICLNSKERHDYELASNLAEEWLKKHPGEANSQYGLGIQWEQARAYEALGDNRELVKIDQERYWKQARNAANQIQKLQSEYRDLANSLNQRMTVKLGGKEKAPADFDTAVGLARQAFSTAQDIKKELDAEVARKAPAEDIAKLKTDWTNELNDALHNFELAFALAKPSDAKKDLLQARLFYAYTNYWLHRNYEAAVLAQFVARTADKEDSTLGLDAAYIAMAAFVQAYNENKAPIDQKTDDLKLIVKASNLIADRWPSSDKASEAEMILGRMLSVQKKPAEAALHFGKIPASDPKYPEAQLAAGQAYWTAYLSDSRKTGSDKPTPEKLADWLKSAQEHLANGIKKMTETTPKEGVPPAELIAAKMSLAQILISQGKDADSLKLMLEDPHSVVKAVQIADEANRPENGVTSRKFAMESYKLILRSYIGMGNLDKARDTMQTLEKIAAAGGVEGGAEVTELYVGLGKLLKDELERLRNNGEAERSDKLMTSFETFLNDMASRKDGQTFGTLSWIGETYFALGETVTGDTAKSNSFYEKAGIAFTEILNRTKADQNFASPAQLYGVKLRQVYVLRLKKEFEPAEGLINDVLKENPNILKVQTAAAELYQDWGTSGQADSVNKLVNAIQGTTKIKGLAWGWSQIAGKLQKSTEYPSNPVYLEGVLNARYNSSFCRYKFAREQTTKDKQKFLEECRTGLIGTSIVTKDMPDEWYQKYNALYGDVLKDLGQHVADLPRSAADAPAAAAPTQQTEEPTPGKTDASKTGDVPVAVKPPESGGLSTTTWILFFGCLLGGAGYIAWTFIKKPTTKKKGYRAKATAGPATFGGIDVGEAQVPVTFAAPPPKPKPRPAASAGTAGTTATKPAAKPTAKPATKAAAPGTAPPKPKPKPPAPPAG